MFSSADKISLIVSIWFGLRGKATKDVWMGSILAHSPKKKKKYSIQETLETNWKYRDVSDFFQILNRIRICYNNRDPHAWGRKYSTWAGRLEGQPSTEIPKVIPSAIWSQFNRICSPDLRSKMEHPVHYPGCIERAKPSVEIPKVIPKLNISDNS